MRAVGLGLMVLGALFFLGSLPTLRGPPPGYLLAIIAVGSGLLMVLVARLGTRERRPSTPIPAKQTSPLSTPVPVAFPSVRGTPPILGWLRVSRRRGPPP
jgi:hypothetical protein